MSVLDCPATGTTVPADYLGLSIEWSMVQHWFGTRGGDSVSAMAAVLRSLQPDPETTGVLRIGGNSQDGFRWAPTQPVTGNALFEGTISTGMVDALLQIAKRSGWRVILGVNLRANAPAEAAALTRYAVSHDRAGRMMAVELGNEPTVYFGADTAGYLARVAAYTKALAADPVTRSLPIAGPSLANNADLAFLTQMRQAYGAELPYVTWHHYANQPSITKLLDESVTTRWTNRIAEVSRAAGATPTRMDEGNSVGTGGLDRVSNVMGSSAWLSDTLLSGAQAGLSGINLHAWDGYYYPRERRTSYYTPFVVRGGLTYPRPSFYALALLRDLPGKRFCRTATLLSPGVAVKTWTLTDPVSGRLFVYTVQKADRASPVTVSVPSGFAPTAALSRIGDPDGCAGRKTDIEGARLPGNGSYAWEPKAITPRPGTTSYDIEVGPCQTALLALTPVAPPPSPKPSPSPSRSPSPSPSPPASPSASATPTASPSPSPSATPTANPSPSESPSPSPSPTAASPSPSSWPRG